MPVALETLSIDEADIARRAIAIIGEREAAMRLGISHVTLYKALARLPVHRLTATVIRSRLRDLVDPRDLCVPHCTHGTTPTTTQSTTAKESRF